MISLSHGFLFVHIPKTGGNSIQTALKPFSIDEFTYSDPANRDRFRLVNRRFDTRKHATLIRYRRKLGGRLYWSLFRFACVRNPWDWMVSLYFSPHSGRVEWDRDEFVALLRRTSPMSHYLRLVSALPGVGWFYREPLGRNVDFLMRFERLDEDFRHVCGKLGLPEIELPRLNQSVHGHYSRYYDPDLVGQVARKFRAEIDALGYRFEEER